MAKVVVVLQSMNPTIQSTPFLSRGLQEDSKPTVSMRVGLRT